MELKTRYFPLPSYDSTHLPVCVQGAIIWHWSCPSAVFSGAIGQHSISISLTARMELKPSGVPGSITTSIPPFAIFSQSVAVRANADAV
jgi:hypothetical protein